jgi:hypothetical protein
MKTVTLFVLSALVLIVVGTLAFMNNACKSSQHPWCAASFSARHHSKTERS